MAEPEFRIGRRRIRLTHPDRVLFPEDGVTKGDLAEYYAEVGDAIVPHLRDRPFTLKRYPDGIRGRPYFHKQAPKGKPAWIPTRRFFLSHSVVTRPGFSCSSRRERRSANSYVSGYEYRLVIGTST